MCTVRRCLPAVWKMEGIRVRPEWTRGEEVGGEAAAAVVQARSDDSDDDGGGLGEAIEVLHNL